MSLRLPPFSGRARCIMGFEGSSHPTLSSSARVGETESENPIRNLKPQAVLELGVPFLFLFGYMTRKLLLVIASCAAPAQSEKEAGTL